MVVKSPLLLLSLACVFTFASIAFVFAPRAKVVFAFFVPLAFAPLAFEPPAKGAKVAKTRVGQKFNPLGYSNNYFKKPFESVYKIILNLSLLIVQAIFGLCECLIV